jgi:hypothetical protein
MTWPGVASTRMIDDCTPGLSVLDWAGAVPLCAIEDKIVVTIAAQFSTFRAPTLLQLTLRFTLLTAFAIAASPHCNLIARSI